MKYLAGWAVKLITQKKQKLNITFSEMSYEMKNLQFSLVVCSLKVSKSICKYTYIHKT